jgi:hypothetical protein
MDRFQDGNARLTEEIAQILAAKEPAAAHGLAVAVQRRGRVERRATPTRHAPTTRTRTLTRARSPALDSRPSQAEAAWVGWRCRRPPECQLSVSLVSVECQLSVS